MVGESPGYAVMARKAELNGWFSAFKAAEKLKGTLLEYTFLFYKNFYIFRMYTAKRTGVVIGFFMRSCS